MTTSISATGISTPAITSGLYNSGQLAGFRNKIINGDFYFWQRGTSSSVAGGTFTADRWRQSGTTTGTFTVSRVATVGVLQDFEEQPYCLQWTQTTSASAGMILEQRIEKVNTLAGGKVCVSFYLRLGSGSLNGATVRLQQNFGSGGSAPVELSQSLVSSISLSEFTRHTFVFDLPSTLSKTIGSNSYLAFMIYLPGGTWSFEITGVQVESGDTPTPFEQRHRAIELQLCQRYYQVLNDVVDFNGVSAYTPYQGKQLITSMRTTPTMTYATSTSSGTWSSLAYLAFSESTYRCYITSAASGSNTWSGVFRFDAEI